MQCTVLQPKGTLRTSTLPATVTGVPVGKDIAAVLRRTTDPVFVGEWAYQDMRLLLFGYKAGKAGTENQHELPPFGSISSVSSGVGATGTAGLFGEAVVVAMKDAPVAFPSTAWTAFLEHQRNAARAIEREDEEREDEKEDEEDDEEEDEKGDDDEDVVSEGSEAGEESDESDSESDAIPEEPEEEEEAPPPVKVTRAKRSNKKTPHWLSLSPITSVSQNTTEPLHPQRVAALSQIHHFLHAQLTPAEEVALERGIMEHTLTEAARTRVHPVWENREFGVLYDVQLRRVIANLCKDSYVKNGRLDVRLHEGEFTVAELPTMGYATLCPEIWKDLFEREMKREARMLEVDKSMATDMFRCTKCGKRQCTYYEMQTRSADEPMTIFVRCLNCGKRWRQ